jgi:hypothetical protein
MSYFFAKPAKYGLQNPKSLPGLLNKELQIVGRRLRNAADLDQLQELAHRRTEWNAMSKELVKKNLKNRIDIEWSDYRRDHAKRLFQKREEERRKIRLQKEEDERLRAEEAERIRTTMLRGRSRARAEFRNSRKLMAGDRLENQLLIQEESSLRNEQALVMFQTEAMVRDVTKRPIVKPRRFRDEW